MKVRTCRPADVPRLQELFERHGFDYTLPALAEMLVAEVVEDKGVIVQAILARPTVEMYMLGDSTWKTPALRMAALRKIHESVRLALVEKGIEDVHAFLPPTVAKSFASRLMRSFHWTKPLWTALTRPTAPQETFRKAG